MIRKLYAFAQGKCSQDNADAFMNHEVLLPGHLITMYVKEKLEDMLINIKGNIVKDYRLNKAKCVADMTTGKYTFLKKTLKNAWF